MLMRKYSIAALAGISVLLCAFAAGKWMTYTSAQGHYSIIFPGTPTESVEETKTEDGKPIKMHMASYSPNDNEVYMVGWVDMTEFYPKDKSVKQMLEDSRDGAAGEMKATNVVTTITNLTGNPFIEFIFSNADFVGKDRIYLINKNQYSIISIKSGTQGIPPVADRFISSFKYIR
jgi:hypothetical protein